MTGRSDRLVANHKFGADNQIGRFSQLGNSRSGDRSHKINDSIFFPLTTPGMTI